VRQGPYDAENPGHYLKEPEKCDGCNRYDEMNNIKTKTGISGEERK
jgi:hypothetical protein